MNGIGASRARTDDLLHAMQALSQLSYSPGRPILEGLGRAGRPHHAHRGGRVSRTRAHRPAPPPLSWRPRAACRRRQPHRPDDARHLRRDRLVLRRPRLQLDHGPARARAERARRRKRARSSATRSPRPTRRTCSRRMASASSSSSSSSRRSSPQSRRCATRARASSTSPSRSRTWRRRSSGSRRPAARA